MFEAEAFLRRDLAILEVDVADGAVGEAVDNADGVDVAGDN